MHSPATIEIQHIVKQLTVVYLITNASLGTLLRMGIGRRLRKTRKALELQQIDVARAIDVSPQYISKIEREESAPSLEKLISLSRTLGVSTDYLLTGRETAPVDIRGAIRSQPITPLAKRSLIQLVGELTKTA